jgi:4-diphosphocytidyl-2-C-methyl-D-erythritol kinase
MMPERWRADAFAKINLALHVAGRRPDGFHEVRTRLQSIALHDTIRLTRRAGDFRLTVHGAALPLGPENLAWRAAAAVWSELGHSGPVRDVELSIEKRIPVEAGLGGGSADAAATLALVAAALGGDLAADRLHGLASRIGADVPFFLTGGSAVGTGRGDVIEPVADPPPRWVVLSLPAFGVSTAGAYRWFDEWAAPAAGPRAASPGGAVASNDLEAPVAARHPDILAIKQRLISAGAEEAAMSGSGSTVFALFAQARAARTAEGALREAGWSARLTRTLSRAEYVRRAAPRRDRRGG